MEFILRSDCGLKLDHSATFTGKTEILCSNFETHSKQKEFSSVVSFPITRVVFHPRSNQSGLRLLRLYYVPSTEHQIQLPQQQGFCN